LVAAGRRAMVPRPIAEKHLQLICPNSPLVNRQSCVLILFVSLRQMGRAATCTAADIQLTFDRPARRVDSGVNARDVGTSRLLTRVFAQRTTSMMTGEPHIRFE
jgi:hypothetical protein